MDNRPIGVFDSGLGGLMAMETLRRRLPREDIIFFGDSGRVPYGGRSRKELLTIAHQNIEFLKGFDVKAILIACGTISTNILDVLTREFDIPIFGVLHPAVDSVLDVTETGKVGIIATQAAIDSGAFARELLAKREDLRITSVACPKFAPMVESGHFSKSDAVVTDAVREYLSPIERAGADTLVLGCTHYSLLASAITDFLGRDVWIVDAGERAAAALIDCLDEKDMLTAKTEAGSELLYTSGDVELFTRSTELFLCRSVAENVRWIEPLPLD